MLRGSWAPPRAFVMVVRPQRARCTEQGGGLSVLSPVVTPLVETSQRKLSLAKNRSIKSECKRTLDILLFRGPYEGGLGVDSGVLRFMGSQRVGHDWETDLIWYPKRVNRNSPFSENKSPKWIHELSLVTITSNPGVIKTTNHWKMKSWLAIGREFEVQFQRSSLISQERERLGGWGRTSVSNSDISVRKPACSVWGSSAHGALRCCTKCMRILGECFYILV